MNLYRLNVEERTNIRSRIHAEIAERDSVFVSSIITDKFLLQPNKNSRILDFGCGQGEMADYLDKLGFDAFGCDIHKNWDGDSATPKEHLAVIQMNPYRLPYPDNNFDLVFSTSVLEHVQNPEDVFSEIHRVLKPGGISMHYFPAKFYLPAEPHILVPLVNFFWPNCPNWWIKFWVLLRAIRIKELRPYWKGMYEKYIDFAKHAIAYPTNGYYRRLSTRVFGNCHSLVDFYIERGSGGFASLARKLGLRKSFGWISQNFRMNFIYQRK